MRAPVPSVASGQTAGQASEWVTLGRLVGVFGVRGEVKVNSYTEPPDALLSYADWHLAFPNGQSRNIKLLSGRPHRQQLIVKLEGITDCDLARQLAGAEVQVPREALPKLKPREYYRTDLIGMRVMDQQNRELGRLVHFIETPAHAVMVVCGAKEHWLPATPEYLRRVDLKTGEIHVDWPGADDD